MKIAVCSDIHDNLAAADKMLAAVRGAADVLLFCGDLCAPFTLKALVDGFPGPIHVVWGNNDGDKWFITEIAHQASQVTLHGEFAELDLDGYKAAVIHYPRIGRALAHSHLYDLVCYGHDHLQHYEHVGKTLLLNPGELLGRFGLPSYAIVTAETGAVEVCRITL